MSGLSLQWIISRTMVSRMSMATNLKTSVCNLVERAHSFVVNFLELNPAAVPKRARDPQVVHKAHVGTLLQIPGYMATRCAQYISQSLKADFVLAPEPGQSVNQRSFVLLHVAQHGCAGLGIKPGKIPYAHRSNPSGPVTLEQSGWIT
jgi:hypothetical protein